MVRDIVTFRAGAVPGRGLASADEVSFNDNAKLDPSQVEDARGGRGGTIAIGGGIAIVILVVSLPLGVAPPAILNAAPTDTSATDPPAQTVAECKPGADANRREDCRIVGYVDS